jgi:hypothetical protein
MVMDASGNVGIGTASPSLKFDVRGPIYQRGSTAADTYLFQTDGTNSAYWQLNPLNVSGSFGVASGQAIPFIVGTNNTERMRITSAGNVGIGVNSPGVKLSVADTNCIVESIGTGGYGAFQAVSSGTNTAYMFFKNAGGEKGRIRADDNGDFYILNGTSATARMLFSGSTGRAYMIGSGSRGQTGYVLTTPNDSISNAIRASGYVEYSTDVGAIGTSYFLSDISLKENIAPSTVSSADIINEFEFVSFDWKEGSGNEGHVNVGVIAQQLQGIDPRLVNTLSDGKMSVSEPALLAHLAKALQEALSEISSLKTRIAALETK